MTQLELDAAVHLSSNVLVSILEALVLDKKAANEGVHEFDLLFAIIIIAIKVASLQAHKVLFHVLSRKFEEDMALNQVFLINPFLEGS